MCQLTRVGPNSFTAPIQSSVTLAAGGAAAVLQSVVYNNTPTGADWTFTVLQGPKDLVVVVANQPGETTQIQETCANGGMNVLDEFNFSPIGPASRYVVTGI